MKAIEIFLSYYGGNQSKAARAIGKKQGHIWHWLNKSDLPIELVPVAARLIGKQPKDLRPDIFDEIIIEDSNIITTIRITDRRRIEDRRNNSRSQ